MGSFFRRFFLFSTEVSLRNTQTHNRRKRNRFDFFFFSREINEIMINNEKREIDRENLYSYYRSLCFLLSSQWTQYCSFIDIGFRLWLWISTRFFQFNLQSFGTNTKSIHTWYSLLSWCRIIVWNKTKTFRLISFFVHEYLSGQNITELRK